MKKKQTIAQMLTSSNNKAPVEQTILQNWDAILRSIANGWSYADVADALRSEGHFVGNVNNTGFTQAVKRIATRKGVDLGRRKIPCGEQAALRPSKTDLQRSSTANNVDHDAHAPADQPTDACAPPSPVFGDTRFSSDF